MACRFFLYTGQRRNNCYDELFGSCIEIFHVIFAAELVFQKLTCDTFKHGLGNHHGAQTSEQRSSRKNEAGLNIVDHLPSQSRMTCCIRKKFFYLSADDFATMKVPEQMANGCSAQDSLISEGTEEPLFFNEESFGNIDQLSCADMP